MAAVILESTLTCPECGHAKTETMPADSGVRQGQLLQRVIIAKIWSYPLYANSLHCAIGLASRYQMSDGFLVYNLRNQWQ